MLQTFVSFTDDPDTQDAASTIIDDLVEQLGGKQPNAGILFCGIDFDHQLILNQIRKQFPSIELIGCTTCGEMAGEMGFAKDSIVLTLLVSDDLEIKAGVGRSLSQNVAGATEAATRQARDKMALDPALCITLPDSLTASGCEVLSGLGQALGENFPIVGGSAGDYTRFSKTWQFYNDELLSDSVPVLLFGGKLLFGHGFASGWKPIGRQGRTTATEGAAVHAIDDKSATDFYLSYIPALDRPNEYPMAVFEKNERFYLRSPIMADPETGTMRFFGDVPNDATVQCTITTRDEVLGAVRDAIAGAAAMYPGTEPAVALLFSCGGRHMYLGSRTPKEYEQVTDYFGENLPPIAGFYTYGEFAPLAPGAPSRFHNTTFVALLLGQR